MENIKVSVKHNDWSKVFDILVELGAEEKTVIGFIFLSSYEIE